MEHSGAWNGAGLMPTLEIFQSLWAMERRRPDGQEWSLEQKVSMIAEAGYDGIDVVHGDPLALGIWPLVRRHKLAATITAFPKSADGLGSAIAEAAGNGVRHLNIIGNVYPLTVDDGARIVERWLDDGEKAGVAITLELHRDAITTDLLYILQLLDAVPRMRLSADLSHIVVAREFPIPLPETMQKQVETLLDRSDAFQGRIASREQIQVPIAFPQHRAWVEQFERWWRYGFASWRRRNAQDARLNFLCELGPPPYAITGAEGWELSDRWEEALRIRERVRTVWAESAIG
jgi:hypothetical protein